MPNQNETKVKLLEWRWAADQTFQRVVFCSKSRESDGQESVRFLEVKPDGWRMYKPDEAGKPICIMGGSMEELGQPMKPMITKAPLSDLAVVLPDLLKGD